MNCNERDLLDFLRVRDHEYLTGVYFAYQPQTPNDVGISFTYEQVDPKSRAYAKIIGEIEDPLTTTAIKTDDYCGFEINGYVLTQSGELWIVSEVVKNVQTEETKEALRLFTETVQTEYLVRLVKTDNPWGLRI